MSSLEPTVDELRRESELSRKALAHTVEELREQVNETANELKTRVSPSHVKAEIRGYVRDSGEQWMETLKQKARENPLQAVAIGAGVAYPLLGLLRAIPTPLLLIGAGLWLAKQNRPQELAGKATDLFSEATRRATDYASTLQDAATDQAGKATRSAAEAGDTIASGVQSLIDKTTDVAGGTKSAVTEMGGKLVQRVHDASDSASQTLSTIKNKATDYSQKSGSAIMDVVERKPLLVAGVGLAIGAFVAAAVPSTGTERELFGKSSDQLKEKARQAAADGVERAKDMASEMAGDVVGAAAREGLSPDGIKKAVEGVTASVKSVAEKGVQAALGGETTSPSDHSNRPAKV